MMEGQECSFRNFEFIPERFQYNEIHVNNMSCSISNFAMKIIPMNPLECLFCLERVSLKVPYMVSFSQVSIGKFFLRLKHQP